jgi:Arc/MetJ-type ribon-helix-helix transcriptional regulator
MYYNYITMSMTTTQVRLPEGLVKEVDRLVDKGLYSNKSDVIRDAIRKLILEKQIGSIPNKGNSVMQVRRARKILSREKINLKETNSL